MQSDTTFTIIKDEDDTVTLAFVVDPRNRTVWLTDCDEHDVEITFGEFERLLAATQRVATFIRSNDPA